MRKRQAKRRPLLPDPRYSDQLVTRFVNMMMWDGKKSVAFKIFYDALDMIAQRMNDAEPIDVFNQAIENIKPALEVKSRRVGGANYQVPLEVRPSRKQALAFRWLLEAAHGRGEKTMAERLAGELMDAFNNNGAAMRKREETHRMAEANKAFAHYRW